MFQTFEILSKVRKEYRRFNAIGRQITVRLNPSSEININDFSHFLAKVKDLSEHAFQNISDSGTIGVAIHNYVNQNDIPIGISFKSDQFPGYVIWSLFEKVDQSSSRFNAVDTFGRSGAFDQDDERIRTSRAKDKR